MKPSRPTWTLLRKLWLWIFPPREKMTWTLLEDLPDGPEKPCTVEQDQEDYLIKRIGLAKWGELCQMEMEDEKCLG